uniref:Cms1 ribosomal small subunit homolog n=1 Tax=Macaca fascicularis TaxID=9541 RepID=A0A2K5VQY3_MACFA
MHGEASDGEGGGDTEVMQQETVPVPAPSEETKQPKECFLIQPKERKENTTKTRKRRKKKITDVLAKSEPKPGLPEDLQKLMKDYYSSRRSVIELEELNLPDSCFLKANDLTHSLSSYLKEICPKWVKLRKNHSEKKSVLMLIICSSAIRALELIRSMTAFRGDSKVIKLFAKHIKVQEQVKLLEKRVLHLGVGTPGRIKELVKQGGFNLNPLKISGFRLELERSEVEENDGHSRDKKGGIRTSGNRSAQSVQVRIFETGPFLSLCLNEDSSLHSRSCILFNDSDILPALSKYQQIVYVNCVSR